MNRSRTLSAPHLRLGGLSLSVQNLFIMYRLSRILTAVTYLEHKHTCACHIPPQIASPVSTTLTKHDGPVLKYNRHVST